MNELKDYRKFYGRLPPSPEEVQEHVRRLQESDRLPPGVYMEIYPLPPSLEEYEEHNRMCRARIERLHYDPDPLRAARERQQQIASRSKTNRLFRFAARALYESVTFYPLRFLAVDLARRTLRHFRNG